MRPPRYGPLHGPISVFATKELICRTSRQILIIVDINVVFRPINLIRHRQTEARK
jgi:hypothetical protein